MIVPSNCLPLRASGGQVQEESIRTSVMAQFSLTLVILLEKIIKPLGQITVLRHADGLICDQLFAMFLHFTIHGEIKHTTNYRSAPEPLLRIFAAER